MRRLARVERAIAPIGVGHTPSDIAGEDLVKMAVGPTHRRLMQTIEPQCQRHLDATQDHGLGEGGLV
jgi:hypothetical protein